MPILSKYRRRALGNLDLTPAQEKKARAERRFPVGTVVEMVKCDDPNPIAPGDKGPVVDIDDQGTIFVKWESGRRLGVLLDQDRIRKVKT